MVPVFNSCAIPTRITTRSSRNNYSREILAYRESPLKRHITGHNPKNCIAVQIKTQESFKASNLFVPSVLLSNVMSLSPKIDELREVAKQIEVDLICITETWLQSHIHDNVVEIYGYNIVRRDRYQGDHGGVCIYVKNAIKYELLSVLANNDHEVIWLKLKPVRLPRGIPCIILCNLYHPPKGNDQDLISHL